MSQKINDKKQVDQKEAEKTNATQPSNKETKQSTSKMPQYHKDEPWVKQYIEENGCEPSFF